MSIKLKQTILVGQFDKMGFTQPVQDDPVCWEIVRGFLEKLPNIEQWSFHCVPDGDPRANIVEDDPADG